MVRILKGTVLGYWYVLEIIKANVGSKVFFKYSSRELLALVKCFEINNFK